MAANSIVMPRRNAASEGGITPLSTAEKIILVNIAAAQTPAT